MTGDLEPALQWTTRHLPQFFGPPDRRGTVKRCAELALVHTVLHTAVRAGQVPASVQPHLGTWLPALHRYCTGPARQAATAGADTVFLLQPYLWLRTAGHRIDTCERILATVTCTPATVGQLYCLWAAGLRRTTPDWAAALRRWLAAWGDDPAAWDRSAYRVTHAAFYTTGFGTRPPAGAPADVRRLGDITEHLLTRWTARARWDLVGELLTALSYLGRHGPAHRAATDLVTAARAADGSTPPTGDAADGFRPRCHPTLVDVLRAAAATPQAVRP